MAGCGRVTLPPRRYCAPSPNSPPRGPSLCRDGKVEAGPRGGKGEGGAEQEGGPGLRGAGSLVLGSQVQGSQEAGDSQSSETIDSFLLAPSTMETPAEMGGGGLEGIREVG